MSPAEQAVESTRNRIRRDGEDAGPAPSIEALTGSPRIARIRRRDARFRRLLALADAAAIGIALSFSAVVLGDDRVTLATLVAPLIMIVVAKAMGLYDRDEHLMHKTTFEEVPSIFALSSVAVLLVYLAGDTLIDGSLGQRQILGTWILLLALMVVLRSLARLVGRLTTPPERCLLIGNTAREASLRNALDLTATAHADLISILPMGRHSEHEDFGGPPPISNQVLEDLDIDRVIIAPGSHGGDSLMFVIREIRDAGVKVSVLPDISRLASASVEIDYIGGITLLGMRRFAISRSSLVIKRTFDVVASAILLILMSPVMAAVALTVRVDSKGSALFKQQRIGLHGRKFRMLKFRSMGLGSESRRHELKHLDEGAEGLFKIPEDPRITRVGAWIRRTSIDELPQLINVLRGDMSLVGPRPLVPEEDEQILGVYRRRLDVRPGMTGHWQVLGSARVPIDEMMKLDYLYVSNWSLWGDLVLLARTIPVVARRRGM